MEQHGRASVPKRIHIYVLILFPFHSAFCPSGLVVGLLPRRASWLKQQPLFRPNVQHRPSISNESSQVGQPFFLPSFLPRSFNVGPSSKICCTLTDFISNSFPRTKKNRRPSASDAGPPTDQIYLNFRPISI